MRHYGAIRRKMLGAAAKPTNIAPQIIAAMTAKKIASDPGESLPKRLPIPQDKRASVKYVLGHYDVSWNDVCGYDRRAHVAEARQIIMALAKSWGWSHAQAGNLVRRDHTTSVHACKKIFGAVGDYPVFSRAQSCV